MTTGLLEPIFFEIARESKKKIYRDSREFERADSQYKTIWNLAVALRKVTVRALFRSLILNLDNDFNN